MRGSRVGATCSCINDGHHLDPFAAQVTRLPFITHHTEASTRAGGEAKSQDDLLGVLIVSKLLPPIPYPFLYPSFSSHSYISTLSYFSLISFPFPLSNPFLVSAPFTKTFSHSCYSFPTLSPLYHFPSFTTNPLFPFFYRFPSLFP